MWKLLILFDVFGYTVPSNLLEKWNDRVYGQGDNN